MKKILLLCASSNSVRNFRQPLIKKLQNEGYQVGVCAFDEDNRELIEGLGVDFFCIPSHNRSLNPLHFIKQKRQYKQLIKDYQPDIVFTFVLKPNTLGVMAAHEVGVKEIYSMVEGAGDAFINKSLKWRLIKLVICSWYKQSFRHAKKVFFLNQDDLAEFVSLKLVNKNKCELIHGIGVDLVKFEQKPVKNDRTFLMIARMLKTKGVLNYCECARIVKRSYPDAVFNYLGAEGTLKLADIQEYIDDGSINYLGTTKDVRPYLEDCLMFMLPSHREGLPMSVMEAEAVGRGIIASDCVGCRDTVIDGYNGYLVPNGDASLMADKVIWAIENPQDAIKMCSNSRKFAEDNFDQEKINQQILDIIKLSDRGVDNE